MKTAENAETQIYKRLSFPDIRRIMDLGKTNTYKLYKKAIATAEKNI